MHLNQAYVEDLVSNLANGHSGSFRQGHKGSFDVRYENLSMPDSGSKVNGLEQPIHPCRVHSHLFNIPDGLEVIEKRVGYEVAFRWFYSKKKAEDFCLGRIGGK